MSTNNFYKVNTDKYYIINFEDNEWSWQNAHEIVAEKIKSIDEMFWIDYTIESKHELKDYPSVSIGEVTYTFKVLGKWWDIKFIIFIRKGYYTGVTLDWEIEIPSYSGKYENINDVINDIEERIKEGEIEGWNKGLWTIHKERIRRKFEEVVNLGIKEIENLFEQVADVQAIKIDKFSNGEALYKEVD